MLVTHYFFCTRGITGKKIADVLLLIENKNAEANLSTYKILIDTKGESRDVIGIDRIVKTIKAKGIEPGLDIKVTLAEHYTSIKLREKAKAILKQMERESLKKNWWLCKFLLPIYAELEKANEVGRIWKFCNNKKILILRNAWLQLKLGAISRRLKRQKSFLRKCPRSGRNCLWRYSSRFMQTIRSYKRARILSSE